MPSFTGYQSYKLNAYATVTLNGTDTILDLARFNTTFAVNTIPFARASVVVGRNITGAAASAIHRITNDLTVAVPAAIYLKVTYGNNSFGPGFTFEAWPSDYFLAFKGIVVGTSYSKSRDTCYFNLDLHHWLSDMDFSSALTRTTNQLTPQQLSGLAGGGVGEGLLPDDGTAFFAFASAAEFITDANVESDLWGDAIGPFLKAVCEEDILSDDDDPDELQHNEEGLAALNMFEPFISGDGEYEYGVPLGMTIANLEGVDSLAGAIAEDIGQEMFSSIASTTLWQKLVSGYGAMYDFKVIPMIERALVVPQIAGQRTPWQTVYGEEYAAISGNGISNRPIKGVRILTDMNSPEGANPNQPGVAGNEPTIGGSYDSPGQPNGMILYQNAPRWAANVDSPAAFGPQAAAPFAPRANGIFPGIGAVINNLLGNRAQPGQVLDQGANQPAGVLWDAVARAVYINAALRGTTGTLQGKLRFDIAPGSTIRIKDVEDQFVLNLLNNESENLIFAEVQAVGIQVDAESMTASTTFTLANTRSAVENADDSLSIASHPLYSEVWTGAPLGENAEFSPSNAGNRMVFT